MKTFAKNLLHPLIDNFKIVLIAFGVAVIIWFAISLQIFPNVTDHVTGIRLHATPTSYMIENNLEIVDDYRNTVSIQIQGKRYEIGNLKSEDFYAFMDLSHVYGPGEHVVNIIVQPVEGVSKNFEIISQTETVTIKIRKIVTKTFNIDVNIDNLTIAEGFYPDQENLKANPRTITVRGESDLVESIKKVEAVVSYEGILDVSTEFTSQIGFYNAEGTKISTDLLELDNDSFTVTVPILKQKELPLSVSFTNVPDNFDLESLQYSITPSTIIIAAPDNTIDNLDKLEIGEIDLSGLSFKDLAGVKMNIKLPEGYKNISGNRVAQITFNNTESYGNLEFTVPRENINIINEPFNYNISILTKELYVTVVGPSETLYKMTSSDINVTLNFLGVEITEGNRSMSVSFRLSGSNVDAWVTNTNSKVDVHITRK
jgi:YbbR domain-containing protein